MVSLDSVLWYMTGSRMALNRHMLGQDNDYPPTNFYGHFPFDLDPDDQHLNVQGDHAR